MACAGRSALHWNATSETLIANRQWRQSKGGADDLPGAGLRHGGRSLKRTAMRLSLENVTKMVREQPYLYDIDLDLASGSFNVLLGPTQAGNCVLVRCFCRCFYKMRTGLLLPTIGQLVSFGGWSFTKGNGLLS